ncbi:MAG: PAS domain-containing protein [Acidobacteriaceae bacterium]|nr:PAS domain-containing protein [Acidobacteriaceae bacterium]
MPQPVRTAGELRSALSRPEPILILLDARARSLAPQGVLKEVRQSGKDVPCILLCDTNSDPEILSRFENGVRDVVSTNDLPRLAPIVGREIADMNTRRGYLKAIASLRDSEQRLRLALAAARTGIWDWNLQTDEIVWSRECYELMRIDEPIDALAGFLKIVHPDDKERVLLMARQAVERNSFFSSEFRIILRTGEIRWVSTLGQAKYDEQERPTCMVGTVRDITEEREAKQRLQDAHHELARYASYYQAILGRMHSVREEERARLARELHDELGGSITTLKLAAHAILRFLDRGDIEGAAYRLQRSVENMDQLLDTVRNICSELRPVLLDQLGLVAALEWQAELLRKQHGFDVSVELPAEEPKLTDTQKITLFRIAQESLTNVLRHSGTRAARVTLDTTANVCLTISDDGIGIADENQLSRSLGIKGMRERARLIGADFVIVGRPGLGTTVRVTIPREPLKGDAFEKQSVVGR